MQRLINEIVERAKANRQRIVLPEGTEERTLKAANQILTDGVADLIILGKPAEIEACAKEWGLGNINKATIIDPEDHPKKEEYAQLLCELRKKKGMTIEEARKLVVDPLYLGCLIIKNGDADGQLAGARNTTGNVLRPALQIIKTSPGITCVSGAMLLLTHAPEYGKNGTIQDYAVTYYRPGGAKMATQWADNQGNVGEVDYLGGYHPQAYYYPLWIKEDSYTLYGTRLKSKTVESRPGFWENRSFEWGYADNVGDDMPSKDNPNASSISNYFKISDAVNLDGSSANLTHIDFIKVQTGVNAKAGWLGENSTEVYGFTDENNKK